MDPVTHAVTGALCGIAAAPAKRIRSAALAGSLGGLLPDLDVLLRSSADPLLQLELHRHFSHSLLFAPLGGLIVAGALLLAMRARRPAPATQQAPPEFPALWLQAALGCASAGLLDACTSYGTHLFWPFTDERLALSLIAVVDPLFSLLVLLALIGALIARRPRYAQAGLLLALGYLALAAMQQAAATRQLQDWAASHGQRVERLQVKPTIGNILLWRGIYESEGRLHVLAIWQMPMRAGRIYPGGSLPRVQPEQLAELPPGSRLAKDLQRYERLADAYLVRHPEDPGLIGDLRFAMLPNALQPLWGVRIDGDASDPARQVHLRELSPAQRQSFLRMLRGQPLAPDTVNENP